MIFIDKRDRKLLIRVNSDEYEVIKKKADKLNLRVAVYIRRMAVKGEIKRYDLSELRDITRSFRMIGTELNQIAKVANSTGEVTGKAVEEIQRQFEILEGVFENYLKPLKKNMNRKGRNIIMKNRRNHSSHEEEYFFKISLHTISDVNEFCNVMTGLERFVVSAEVRSGTYIVDAKSLMGIFSLNLSKPVEVWFKVEMNDQLRNMDMDKYFAAKIERWLVGENANE